LERDMSVSRKRFIGLSAAALPVLAACGGGSSGTPLVPNGDAGPVPAAPALPAGAPVADLRFGFSPTPAVFPGYDPAGDAKALIVAGTPSPATARVPGTLAAGSYAVNERYVIKVPQAWNGKLIVAGTPAFRSEFAGDAIWGDFALANGYAYASSNKVVQFNAIVETVAATPSPATFFPIPFDLESLETLKYGFRFGALTQTPRPLIGNWNVDFATLTVAAQAFLKRYFGKAPLRTYAVGLSNGGAQVRSLLEQYPSLVDGGVDWSGVFWSPSLNILTYLPKFLAAMPAYVASGFTNAAAAAAIVAAGYPADAVQAGNAAHPSLWYEYYAGQASFYSDLTTFAYALLLDPQAASSTSPAACTPNTTNARMLPGTCDATGLALPANRAAYVPSAAAQRIIAGFAHTGAIGKPLVSIAGGSDMFITAHNNATPYLRAVNVAGRGSIYWQYIVAGGTHVDTFSPFGYGLQPQLPFAWAAFRQLVARVEGGFHPPGAGSAQPVATPAQIRSA
jgi:hypothetical protein